MMRFPGSLSTRLIIVIGGLLILAQLGSAVLLLGEQVESLNRFSGRQAVERIIGIVRLLDELESSERRRATQVLSIPPVKVRLIPPPAGQLNGEAHAHFRNALQVSLGGKRPLRVTVQESDALRNSYDDFKPAS